MISNSFKNTKYQNQASSQSQFRSIGILLILGPILMIGWGFLQKPILPINQLEFFKFVILCSTLSYAFVWCLSFLGRSLSKVIFLTTLFTYFLWLIGGLMTLAVINSKFDNSSPLTYYRMITRKHQSLGGGIKTKSPPSCTVWFSRPIQNSDYGPLRYGECDLVEVGSDGVMYTMRSGLLGHMWIQDKSVVKNYKQYVSSLGLSEDPQ